MVRIIKLMAGLLLAFLYVILATINPIEADEEDNIYAPVIVKSYKVSDDIIIPGEYFELTIEIENTDVKNPANGVLINLSFPEGINTVYPTLTQIYLKTIKPGAKETVTFEMKASSSYARSTVVFGVSLVSADKSNNTYLYAPVKTDTSSFKIISKMIPVEANVGDKIAASLSFKSLIDERLSNVTLQVFVDEREEAVSTANIGNISAEASKTQNVMFSIDEKGSHYIRFVLSYSLSGEAITTTELYTGVIQVNDEVAQIEPQVQEIKEEKLTTQDKTLIIGCIGASILLFVGIILIAKKNN